MTSSLPRPRILAIDDTPANLMVLAKSLAAEFDVQLAVSGPAGLSLARTSRPDLVLLDVMMPEVDGYETCRQFKADPALADIPVIFLTALADQGSEARGLALGALDYLTKPFNIDIARQRITNLIERQRYLRDVQAQRDQLELRVAERTQEILRHQADLAILKDMAERSCLTKAKLLRAVGSELREPMQSMATQVARLREQLSDPEMLACVSDIEEAVNHLLAHSSDLLDHVESTKPLFPQQLETFTLHDLEAGLLAECLPQARAQSVAFRVELDGSESADKRLLADQQRLLRLIVTLVLNAFEFAGAGEVRVLLGVSQLDGTHCQLACDVIDGGDGMGQETRAALFSADMGTADLAGRERENGFGLPMCRELAVSLGGTLTAQSQPGVGNALSLRLPVQAAADEAEDFLL